MLQDWTLSRIRASSPRYRRCLDLGCGIGDWTERFAEIADEVHACDVSPDFVTETRRRVPEAIVRCADIRAYRWPRQLDLVYVGAVLTYVSDGDVLDVLHRIRAATVPSALVVVRVHRRPRDLRDLAKLAGFSCVEVRSSPSIYGEVMARGVPLLQWPVRMLWRLATAAWVRASHTLVLRA